MSMPPDDRSTAGIAHLRQGREIMAELEFLEGLRQYFRGEKVESIAILAGSILLLAIGAALYAGVSQQFTRGLAAVLLMTGLIGVVVGGTIVLRTDRQVAELTSLYESDRTQFASAELPRIERVVRSFRTYRIAYALAVVTALAFLMLGGRPLLHGLGVGLILFAALGFTVDHYAEHRAVDYAARVRSAVSHPATR